MTKQFSHHSLFDALQEIKNGRMIILIDDESRENEGDLVLGAQMVTPSAINFMATYGRGLICLALKPERIRKLHLPLMVPVNRLDQRAAFTVSVDAKEGIGSGISAFDRAKTIQVAIAPSTRSEDLVSPGHVFPLCARENGVLDRLGHTEGSVDLVDLAGLFPAAVICEILSEDGHMASRQELIFFSKRHNIPIVFIADIIRLRKRVAIPVDEALCLH